MVIDNKDGFENYLLRTIKNENKNSNNLIVSPFSILSAMTVCMLGSANNTLKQMLNVLYPNRQNKKLSFENAAKFTAEIVELGKYYSTKYDGSNGNALIRVANKIWVNKGYKILEKYIKASQVDAVGSFDKNNGNDAATVINKWCAETTNNMIKELVDSNTMSQSELVIANAIYFKGLFAKPFDKKQTAKNVPFYATKKRETEISKVEMMQSETVQCAAHRVNGIYDVIKLQYKTDGNLSLILALDKYSKAEQENVPLLSTKDIVSLCESNKWHQRKIKLFLPKFKFVFEITLNDILQKMGIKDAFDGKADFSNMTGTLDLRIDSVIHKAVIEVDEEGTEAAAATVVTMTRMMFKPTPVCKFDHPFQFFIFDEVKKVALFAGIFNGK